MNFQDRVEQYAISSLGAEQCPNVARLMGYLSNNLPGMQRLAVAAHVRLCPLCTRDVELSQPPDLGARWSLDQRPSLRPGVAVARIVTDARIAIDARIATDRLIAQMRTASPAQEDVRQYAAADIAIHLTIAPPVSERWRISGFITRGREPLAERTAALRSRQRRFRQETNSEGFFTFTNIPPGHYTLSLVEASVSIQIRDLILNWDSYM